MEADPQRHRILSTERLKLVYGFAILLMLFVLAMSIALGKVEAATSYGLLPVIATLSTLAGAFAQWAFDKSKDGKGES